MSVDIVVVDTSSDWGRKGSELVSARIELPKTISSIADAFGKLMVSGEGEGLPVPSLTPDDQSLKEQVLRGIDILFIRSMIDRFRVLAEERLKKIPDEATILSIPKTIEAVEWDLVRVRMDKHSVREEIRTILGGKMGEIDRKKDSDFRLLRSLVHEVMEIPAVMDSLSQFQSVLDQMESKWVNFRKTRDGMETLEREVDAPMELRTNIVRLSLALLGHNGEMTPAFAGKFSRIKGMSSLTCEKFQEWSAKTFSKVSTLVIEKGSAIAAAQGARLAAAFINKILKKGSAEEMKLEFFATAKEAGLPDAFIERISEKEAAEEMVNELRIAVAEFALAEPIAVEKAASIKIPPIKSYLDICVPDETNPLMRVAFNPFFLSEAQEDSTPDFIFGAMEFPGMELTPIYFEIRFDDPESPEVRILSQTFPLSHEVNSVDEDYGRFTDLIRIIFGQIQIRSGENARLTFAHETMRRAYEKEPEPKAPDAIKTVGVKVKPTIYSLGEIRVMSEEIDKKMTDSRFWEDIVVRVNQARSFSVPFDIQTAFKPRPESPGITVRTAGNLDGTFREGQQFEGCIFIQGLTKDQEFLQIRGDLSTKTLRVECDSSPRFDGEGNVTRLRSVWLRAIAAMKSAFEENGWTVGFKRLKFPELPDSDPCSEALYLAVPVFDESWRVDHREEFVLEDPLTFLIEVIQRKLRGIKEERIKSTKSTVSSGAKAVATEGLKDEKKIVYPPARVFVRTPYSDPEARKIAKLQESQGAGSLDGQGGA